MAILFCVCYLFDIDDLEEVELNERMGSLCVEVGSLEKVIVYCKCAYFATPFITSLFPTFYPFCRISTPRQAFSLVAT
jgi:hypothetical protein